tara:strand:- start:642 stop:1544 length:903 start_codon:yes stop_codon:yes gene_type:complete
MDTRRDQLQLLEHFTTAINGDSARPQIAQLTELGLVELTRKRQGQNIYELFGKTCSTCQGQGHLPNITIENKKQIISSEVGSINSASIAGNDIQSLQENNTKKKRINKTKDIETNLINEAHKSSSDNSTSISSDTSGDNISLEINNNKQEKISVNIKMNKNEEIVYSSMGLDPILLLEEMPLFENYTVHIIRPGQEEGESREGKEKAIIEGTRKDNLNNSNLKQKKDNKDIAIQNNNLIEKDLTNSQETENINIDLGEETNELISADNISINEKNELNASESIEVNEDPRRKRRRSSASS